MVLTLIRHSESQVDPRVPITSWGLSDKGKELAHGLSRRKELQDIEVVYTSAQPKAIETTELMIENSDIDRKIDDRLTEISSFTRKFVPVDVLIKNTEDFLSGKVERLYGGESIDEALKRFTAAIHDIVAAEQQKQNIGIVSHGAILACFVSQFINKPALEFHQEIGQPDIAILDWENTTFKSFFGSSLED